MNVSKQLAMNFSVHGVTLPIDVINIIRSFAFEDRIVASVKKQMKEIVKTIDTASVSRKNSTPRVHDTSENWEFRICDDSASQLIRIQNVNCRKCGEFWPSCNYNLVCKCIHEDANEYENDDDSDNDPWYWQY